MSIVGFHRVLIATAILFCGVFGVWEALAFARRGGWVDLALAAAFGVAGCGLGFYLAHLNRFLDRTPSR